MLEKALKGSKGYYIWVIFLLAVIGAGSMAYLVQFKQGLTVTGLARDVSWGFYIAQFTFLVGVAASAVMVVLPYYLHNFKAFGKITVLGEFIAVSSVIMCQLFVVADMGFPTRVMNVFLHPSPNSVMFWDVVVLTGYLGLNLVIGYTALGAERKEVPPPKWIKPLIYLSIPWAVSIHTVTAFLYAGLPGRHLWLTAIMAPRFLASAFAAGPALLIILALILRKVSKFDAGDVAIHKLAEIVTYAMLVNIFFFAMEFFTAFYSHIPGHVHGLEYLFFGLHEGTEVYHGLVPFMRFAAVIAFISVFLMVIPSIRRNLKILPFACAGIFIASWIDKGMGLVVGGFVPNPFGRVYEYSPTWIELTVTIGIYCIGLLMLTLLYKIAITVKQEVGGDGAH